MAQKTKIHGHHRAQNKTTSRNIASGVRSNGLPSQLFVVDGPYVVLSQVRGMVGEALPNDVIGSIAIGGNPPNNLVNREKWSLTYGGCLPDRGL